MAKIKPKRFYIHDDIYHISWRVLTGTKEQEAVNYISKLASIEPVQLEHKLGKQACFYSHTSLKGGAIWFKDARPGGALVAHECLHAVHFLMTHGLDSRLTDDTEEFFAYYLQYLVSQIGRRVW